MKLEVAQIGGPKKLARRLPLALEAVLYLSAASLGVRVASERRITRLLGVPVEQSAGPIGPPGLQARRVARAVTLVATWLPWHPTCLPQTIATRWMLRRRGIGCETHLGIVSTSPFKAHAWVTVRGAVVQGGPVAHMARIATLR